MAVFFRWFRGCFYPLPSGRFSPLLTSKTSKLEHWEKREEDSWLWVVVNEMTIPQSFLELKTNREQL